MAAQRLARIFGTEEDKVNCPFYYKIGACRHEDRCSRQHHKPTFSPTLLIKHLYPHPVRARELAIQNQGGAGANVPPLDPIAAREFFYDFVEDLHMEFSKFGRIDAIHVVDNLGDHLVGHVYLKFYREEDAADALAELNQIKMYSPTNTVLEMEFSPVTDFREARCRDYDDGHCARGGFCNFLHVLPIPPPLIRSLEQDAADEHRRRTKQQSRMTENQSSRAPYDDRQSPVKTPPKSGESLEEESYRHREMNTEATTGRIQKDEGESEHKSKRGREEGGDEAHSGDGATPGNEVNSNDPGDRSSKRSRTGDNEAENDQHGSAKDPRDSRKSHGDGDNGSSDESDRESGRRRSSRSRDHDDYRKSSSPKKSRHEDDKAKKSSRSSSSRSGSKSKSSSRKSSRGKREYRDSDDDRSSSDGSN
jgi:splicing factor U2AF 35 kDa subunit